MSDSLERYRQAWIQEAGKRQRAREEEATSQPRWRERATQFIAEHDLADLLAACRMGDAEFPSSGWAIRFPLWIPYRGGYLHGAFSLVSDEETVGGAIECDGCGGIALPATDAQIGHWLYDLERWALSSSYY